MSAGLPPVWAVAAYDGAVRAALIAHKEQGRLSLAKPLGRALALSVMGLLSSCADVGAGRLWCGCRLVAPWSASVATTRSQR